MHGLKKQITVSLIIINIYSFFNVICSHRGGGGGGSGSGLAVRSPPPFVHKSKFPWVKHMPHPIYGSQKICCWVWVGEFASEMKKRCNPDGEQKRMILLFRFPIDTLFNMAYTLWIIYMNHTVYLLYTIYIEMVSTHNCNTPVTSGSPEHNIAEHHFSVVK